MADTDVSTAVETGGSIVENHTAVEGETCTTSGFVDFVPQVLDRKRERKVTNFKDLEDQAFHSVRHLKRLKPKSKESKVSEKAKPQAVTGKSERYGAAIYIPFLA